MFAFRIIYGNIYILQQFIDSNKDFSPEALYTAVFLHRNKRQAMKNIIGCFMNMLKMISKAFDIVYDLLDIAIKLGMVLVYLIFRWFRFMIIKTN